MRRHSFCSKQRALSQKIFCLCESLYLHFQPLESSVVALALEVILGSVRSQVSFVVPSIRISPWPPKHHQVPRILPNQSFLLSFSSSSLLDLSLRAEQDNLE